MNLPREWRLVSRSSTDPNHVAEIGTPVQIHKSPWSAVKVLYLLCRYWVIGGGPWVLWVFIGDHSEETCHKIYRSPQILAVSTSSDHPFAHMPNFHCFPLQMWNQIWAECVLIVRVYAFWGNSKPLLAVMCTLMLSMCTYQVWCTVKGMARESIRHTGAVLEDNLKCTLVALQCFLSSSRQRDRASPLSHTKEVHSF